MSQYLHTCSWLNKIWKYFPQRICSFPFLFLSIHDLEYELFPTQSFLPRQKFIQSGPGLFLYAKSSSFIVLFLRSATTQPPAGHYSLRISAVSFSYQFEKEENILYFFNESSVTPRSAWAFGRYFFPNSALNKSCITFIHKLNSGRSAIAQESWEVQPCPSTLALAVFLYAIQINRFRTVPRPNRIPLRLPLGAVQPAIVHNPAERLPSPHKRIPFPVDQSLQSFANAVHASKETDSCLNNREEQAVLSICINFRKYIIFIPEADRTVLNARLCIQKDMTRDMRPLPGIGIIWNPVEIDILRKTQLSLA